MFTLKHIRNCYPLTHKVGVQRWNGAYGIELERAVYMDPETGFQWAGTPQKLEPVELHDWQIETL